MGRGGQAATNIASGTTVSRKGKQNQARLETIHQSASRLKSLQADFDAFSYESGYEPEVIDFLETVALRMQQDNSEFLEVLEALMLDTETTFEEFSGDFMDNIGREFRTSKSIFQVSGEATNALYQRLSDDQTQWFAGLSNKQKEAFAHYKAHGFEEINNHLRHNHQTPKSIASIAHIDSMFDEVPRTKEPVLLSRGMEYTEDELERFGISREDILSNYQKGSITTEPSYLSTEGKPRRISNTHPSRMSILIELPAGSRMLSCAAFQGQDKEQEFVLPKNTKLEILECVESGEDNLLIYAKAYTG